RVVFIPVLRPAPNQGSADKVVFRGIGASPGAHRSRGNQGRKVQAQTAERLPQAASTPNRYGLAVMREQTRSSHEGVQRQSGGRLGRGQWHWAGLPSAVCERV